MVSLVVCFNYYSMVGDISSSHYIFAWLQIDFPNLKSILGCIQLKSNASSKENQMVDGFLVRTVLHLIIYGLFTACYFVCHCSFVKVVQTYSYYSYIYVIYCMVDSFLTCYHITSSYCMLNIVLTQKTLMEEGNVYKMM